MATTYSTRPSAILGLPPASWEALALDSAALALADHVELAVDKARARAGTASPAALEARVRSAVKRILTTPRERAAEEAWRERARARTVDVVWERPGDPTSLRAIVREGRRP